MAAALQRRIPWKSKGVFISAGGGGKTTTPLKGKHKAPTRYSKTDA